jgi:hypothetical protein
MTTADNSTPLPLRLCQKGNPRHNQAMATALMIRRFGRNALHALHKNYSQNYRTGFLKEGFTHKYETE